MKKLMVVVAGVIMASGMASAHAADIEAGKAKYESTCLSCHGAEGKGQAIFPAVTGQDAAYVTEKLEQYRAGEQVGQHTALMAPHARTLSDEDIANLAAYIDAEFN
ncbi:c-type cytochrome [Thioalkalivibrio paradoxus]|uniref:Cytochrome C n=1 Tax=Thioalkalivibrio paradoxus ARh 1 TaxID=713585 RepID=W0DLP1_9GAMM|nr:c-type cytochrome [Thioalkalivibrio paradoxus]AHE99519.1 cytochrome C [Thioalkalivibrio paradoxus ARh 1]